ncbi:hypothetical protein [Roseiflexus castenholzii]|uniref:Putative FHA domain containing protein n=1 Tax=Roseiflexus castenholzii (strain DSM 13941 / HLO8) TaxID=383372 RepID=A7NLB9_ROSCS|nr:hypothetical protein [Roseiflexus castenholzii]ABU58302.1 putative FHA domain containing protein [Roseiflexus castenholzii DSM 13941]
MIWSNRNPYLPPWLQDVPLPPKPPAPEQEDTGDAPLFSGLPEWLRDEDETDQATTPSWLRPAPDTLGEEASTPARTPGSEPAPIAPFAPPAPSEASPPSWLQSLRDSIVMPDTPESDETASESAPWTSTEASDIGLPSGLSTGRGEMEAPPWLANERPEHHADASPDRSVEAHTGRDRPSWSGDAGEEQNEVDLPAWLRELPVTDDMSQTPLPASKARSENLPDWLRDVAAAPPEPPSAPPSAAPAPTGDLPDWLRDVAAAPPEPPSAPPSAAPAPTGDLPDWLRDVAAAPPEPPSAPPSAAPAPTGDLPDWLRDIAAAPPEPPSAPPSAAPAPTGDLPDWLRDVAAAPPEPPSAAPSAAPAPTGDLPDWLRDIAAAPPEPPSAPPSAAPAPTGDLPDWLRDVAAAPPEPPSAPPSAAPAPTGDLPDWLRDIAAAPPEPPSAPPSVAPAPTGDLPDWLRDVAAAPPEPPSAPPSVAPAPTGDLPDWLRNIAAAPPEPPSAPPSVAPAPTGDLPDWLRNIAAAPPEPPSAPPSAPVPPAGGVTPPAGDLPDWLRTPASSSQETPPWLEDEHGRTIPSGDAGLPDWLRGIDITPPDARDGQPQTMASPAAQISSDLLSGMDLPEWLRVESEPKPETAPASARDLDWLKRLGGIVEDEAGVGTAVAAPKLPPPPAPQRTEEQMQALNLLRHLAAEPIPSAAPLPAPERESALQRIGLDRLLSITLLVLVIIAVAFSGVAPSLEAPPLVPAVSDTYDQIAALGANDVVLVGYEWDARRVGELRPLERAVIGHLITQNVKLILVSTDPQGTLLQFDLLDTLRNAGYRQQGEGYLLLGYKPGGEIALRTLARDFQAVLRSDYRGDDATGSALIAGIDTGRPVARLNDLSLIIVLADDTPDVQGWMEQVYPQAQTGDQPTPMVFLLPEEAAPVVQPYMRQPGVAAIAGQRGALAYTAISQGSGAPGVAEAVTHQRLVILLFVVVLVSGLAISGINAARRRRP